MEPLYFTRQRLPSIQYSVSRETGNSTDLIPNFTQSTQSESDRAYIGFALAIVLKSARYSEVCIAKSLKLYDKKRRKL